MDDGLLGVVQGIFLGVDTVDVDGVVLGFKLLDGFLSSKMDDNDKSVTMLLERRQRELEGKL